MKTIKVSELTGASLDFAVASCEGISTAEFIALQKLPESDDFWKYRYSTNWAQGGPIIERERFTRMIINTSGDYTVSTKRAELNEEAEPVIVWVHGVGPTPLIAAMRCYVASKLGDTVEVPKELAT